MIPVHNQKSITKKLMAARTISYFGSAFSDLVLPLFIYEITKSPVLMGLQWTLNALFRLGAGRIAGRINFWKLDKVGIVWLDLLQALAAITPLFFWSTSPTTGTYISSVALSVFVTIQAGYNDSLIRNTANLSPNPDQMRTWINAKLENGKNIGLFFGYLIAWAVATYAGFKFAIILDSLTFVLSALVTLSIKEMNPIQQSTPPKASYSLLFKNKTASLLTLSQASLSFSIYVFNAAFIYTMKHSFGAPNSAVAALLIMQAFCYIIGSHFASKFTHLSMRDHSWFRVVFVVIFVGFVFSNSSLSFIFWNAILSLLISFTQPGIVSFFQSFATNETSRALGSARISIMTVSGSVGAAMTGFLLSSYSHQIAFGLGTIMTIVGSGLFFVASRSSNKDFLRVGK